MTHNERFSPAICANLLVSVARENARRTSGYASAFREQQSLKIFTHLIREDRSLWV